MTNRCDSCIFWERMKGRHGPEDVAPGGLCRRFPPQIIWAALTDRPARPHHYFPIAMEHDWCGEYEARPDDR